MRSPACAAVSLASPPPAYATLTCYPCPGAGNARYEQGLSEDMDEFGDEDDDDYDDFFDDEEDEAPPPPKKKSSKKSKSKGKDRGRA